MGAMKRKAAEQSSVSSGYNWRRRAVGAVKSMPKPVTFGSSETWVRGDKIGEGGFGSVFVAFSKKRYIELLKMPKSMAIKSAKMKDSDSIQFELKVYRELNGRSCPFLIAHYGEELTISSRGEKVYNLALEIAWGSLERLITDSGKGLPEWDVRGFAGEILEGVKHIHKGGYVHCDLKPDNILLVEGEDVEGKVLYTAKVGDLGLCKEEEEKGGWRGTPTYLAPETIYEGKQERPSDIWAVGLIVLEMLTGRRSRHVSYENETGDFYIDEGSLLQPQVPDTVSSLAREFIGLCLEEVPEHRWTAEELLAHQFVAEVR